MVILSVLFLFLGAAKALSDLSAEGSDMLPLKWWKGISWVEKWAWEGDERVPNIRPAWMYLWIWTPKYQEKFLWSSLLFVNITDFWHKTETARILIILAITYFASPAEIIWTDLIILWGLRTLGFNLVYGPLKDD